MINKNLALGFFVVASLSLSEVQAIAVSYPSRKILERIDHITSLLTTASFVGGCTMTEHSHGHNACTAIFVSSPVLNVMANVMTLKYDNKIPACLRILLPIAILGSVTMVVKYGKTAGGAASNILISALILNVVKNVWGIYSLTRDISSSLQDMRTKAYEVA